MKEFGFASEQREAKLWAISLEKEEPLCRDEFEKEVPLRNGISTVQWNWQEFGELGGYGIERNEMKQPEPEPRTNSEHHVPLPESKGTLSRETPEQPLTKYQYQNNQPVQEPVPVTNAKPGRLT